MLSAKPQWFRAIGFLRGTTGSCRLGLGVMAMREVTVRLKTTMAALKQMHVASVISELESISSFKERGGLPTGSTGSTRLLPVMAH